MKPSEVQKVIQIMQRGTLKTDPLKDRQVLDTALKLYRLNHQKASSTLWKQIIGNWVKKLSPVAALLLVTFTLLYWHASDNTVWALEQTRNALQRIQTLYVYGQIPDGENTADFRCWIRLPSDREGPLQLRYESDKKTVVVNDDIAYEYWPHRDAIRIKSGPQMQELRLWYMAAELGPWLSGSIFKTMKLLADDWVEVVETESFTGLEIIHATCSYPPTQTSFWFQVDPETQLLRAAKLWKNLHHAGRPAMDIREFQYNVETPTGCFEFTIPKDAWVINGVDNIAENETKPRYVACENNLGAGFYWLDTCSGKIWWASPGDIKWVFLGTPEGAMEGQAGRYVPRKNKSGAGIFILDSQSGDGWWTNGKRWKRFGKPKEKADNISEGKTDSQFVACENHAGAGFFWIDTSNGKVWWASPGDIKWVYYGKPQSVTEGQPGRYLPYLNRSGGGLFILDTLHGKGWWTNGEEWKNFGEPKMN